MSCSSAVSWLNRERLEVIGLMSVGGVGGAGLLVGLFELMPATWFLVRQPRRFRSPGAHLGGGLFAFDPSRSRAREWPSRLTNARTEGFNTKAKLVKRRAYGYISFRNYRLRLLNACNS